MSSSAGLLRHPARAVFVSLAAFVLALWAELLLDQWTGRFALVAFAPAIAISAWLGGVAPAFMTILLSVVASDFYLFGPDRFFDFRRAEGIALVFFTIGWAAVAIITGAAARRVSQERTDRLAAERVAAQAHRLAQSTAALGQARACFICSPTIASKSRWPRLPATRSTKVIHGSSTSSATTRRSPSRCGASHPS
jgi:K+-sensing histidine kinase KdpD